MLKTEFYENRMNNEQITVIIKLIAVVITTLFAFSISGLMAAAIIVGMSFGGLFNTTKQNKKNTSGH